MLEQIAGAVPVRVGPGLRPGQAEQSSAVADAGSPTPEGRGLTHDACLSAIGQSLAQLLKRPEIQIEHLLPILREIHSRFFRYQEIRENPRKSVAAVASISSSTRNDLKSIETEIKYEGYLLQQQRAIERLKKAEQHTIPQWFDYGSVSGLSREMQEILVKIRPRTLATPRAFPASPPPPSPWSTSSSKSKPSAASKPPPSRFFVSDIVGSRGIQIGLKKHDLGGSCQDARAGCR